MRYTIDLAAVAAIHNSPLVVHAAGLALSGLAHTNQYLFTLDEHHLQMLERLADASVLDGVDQDLITITAILLTAEGSGFADDDDQMEEACADMIIAICMERERRNGRSNLGFGKLLKQTFSS